MTTMTIPGYEFGTVAQSSVSLEELHELEDTVGWTDEDASVLKQHASLFEENAERMVDSWRAAIGKQPHLAQWFFGPDGKPDEDYKASVKKRFVKWVVDAVSRPHDQAWLDYQEEIGLRHTPEKKNKTDRANTPPVVPLRFLLGFIPIVTLSARSFFLEGGVRGEELERLCDAWTKTVQLHVTLWTRPYAKDGLW